MALDGTFQHVLWPGLQTDEEKKQQAEQQARQLKRTALEQRVKQRVLPQADKDLIALTLALRTLKALKHIEAVERLGGRVRIT